MRCGESVRAWWAWGSGSEPHLQNVRAYSLSHLYPPGSLVKIMQCSVIPLSLPSLFFPRFAHTMWVHSDIPENPVALKVLVWSRGLLVTLQILTSSSFSLVEETHGSSGQCVSFSLIDLGSGFTAYVVCLFFSDIHSFKAAWSDTPDPFLPLYSSGTLIFPT